MYDLNLFTGMQSLFVTLFKINRLYVNINTSCSHLMIKYIFTLSCVICDVIKIPWNEKLKRKRKSHLILYSSRYKR